MLATEALWLAEVERFLKKGILDVKLDDCDEADDVDEEDAEKEDAEEAEASVDSESMDVSDPVRDRTCSEPFMSPKNLVASCTASECGTPANATTVLSGR